MKSWGTMVIKKDILYIGGMSTVELVRRYGSPLIVLDEKVIRDNARNYITSLNKYYPKTKIAYAGKAFINRTLCKILKEEGLNLDVVSSGELSVALEAGFPADKIYFHGNNKSVLELKMILQTGIGRVMVDSLQEVKLLDQLASEHGKKVKVILRLAPGIRPNTHKFIQTGQFDSKFGINILNGQALQAIKEIISLKNIELMGLHAHIGSQICDLSFYKKAIDIMIEFMQEVREDTGHIFKELDLGGGLGIAYRFGETDPVIDEFAKVIAENVQQNCLYYDLPLPLIIVEPGRSIIGNAGTTLYTVGIIKDIPGIKRYIFVDGGMTDNIRPALYGANYEAIVANKASRERVKLVTIAGKCCETGDVLIKETKLPEVESGDILAVFCTGAYSYSMSSNYNGLLRPAVILVNDGQADVIIRRESFADLMKNDLIPERFQAKQSLF